MGESVGDLTVQTGDLQGVEVGPAEVPSCIDELPALAVVAAFARGRTVVRGAQELKLKESDRLEGIARMLTAFGSDCRLLADGFEIQGGARLRPGEVSSGDHRIVMAAIIMGALIAGTSRIGCCRWLGISYPDFLRDLQLITGEFALA